jgi:hypothetical protein
LRSPRRSAQVTPGLCGQFVSSDSAAAKVLLRLCPRAQGYQEDPEIVVAVNVSGGDTTAVGGLRCDIVTQLIGAEVPERQKTLNLSEVRPALQDPAGFVQTASHAQKRGQVSSRRRIVLRAPPQLSLPHRVQGLVPTPAGDNPDCHQVPQISSLSSSHQRALCLPLLAQAERQRQCPVAVPDAGGLTERLDCTSLVVELFKDQAKVQPSIGFATCECFLVCGYGFTKLALVGEGVAQVEGSDCRSKLGCSSKPALGECGSKMS